MALLRDGIELVVGSVGDSRAMLCRKGKAVKLTVDHTPERKDEKERYSLPLGVLTSPSRLRCCESTSFDPYVFVSEGYARLGVLLRGIVWVSLMSTADWP